MCLLKCHTKWTHAFLSHFISLIFHNNFQFGKDLRPKLFFDNLIYSLLPSKCASSDWFQSYLGSNLLFYTNWMSSDSRPVLWVNVYDYRWYTRNKYYIFKKVSIFVSSARTYLWIYFLWNFSLFFQMLPVIVAQLGAQVRLFCNMIFVLNHLSVKYLILPQFTR